MLAARGCDDVMTPSAASSATTAIRPNLTPSLAPNLAPNLAITALPAVTPNNVSERAAPAPTGQGRKAARATRGGMAWQSGHACAIKRSLALCHDNCTQRI